MTRKRKMIGLPAQEARSRVYSYSRFSSRGQEGGDSLRRQERLLAEWCEKNGVSLDEVISYSDEAVSAYRGRHADEGDLAHFVQLVGSGAVPRGSILLVENMDRLGRDQPRRALLRLMGLIESGIVIITLAPERRFDETTSNEWSLMEAFVSAKLAHDESEKKGVRSRQNWRQKQKGAKERILTSTCPAWLRPREDRKGFEVVEENAKWVREMFRLAIDGMGSKKIAQRLDKLTGGKSIVTRKRRSGSTQWEPGYVRQLLTDRAVLGEYQPHRRVERRVQVGGRMVTRLRSEPIGEPVAGYYPAVIDEATWARARAAVVERRKYAGGPNNVRVCNLFTGLMTCARTGHQAVVKADSNIRTWDVFRLVTGRGSVRMAPVEAALLRLFASEIRLGEDDGQQTAAREADALQARIDQLQQTIDAKTAELIATPSASSLLWDIVHRMDAEIRQLRPQLAEARQRVQSRPVQDMDRLRAALKTLAKAKGDDLIDARLRVKARIRRVVERIYALILDEPYYHEYHLHWRRRVKAEVLLRDGSRYGLVVYPDENPKAMPRVEKAGYAQQIDGGELTAFRYPMEEEDESLWLSNYAAQVDAETLLGPLDEWAAGNDAIAEAYRVFLASRRAARQKGKALITLVIDGEARQVDATGMSIEEALQSVGLDFDAVELTRRSLRRDIAPLNGWTFHVSTKAKA